MRNFDPKPGERARLLSFDGGGIRGLFSLQYAKRIESLLRAKTGNPDLVLADHFHYIGGTSTGAIIASCLSWGLAVDDIEALYRKNAIAMFTKSGIIKRFFSDKFVAAGLTKFLQDYFVEDDGEFSRFDTEKLRTLLLIVTRNASTGSPWPLSNNPAAKYNDPVSPGNNLQIPLWQLVRASTAAPTFFPPEILLVKGEEGERLEFAFEDGGITPFNNPAYVMKLMATLPEYNLNWPTGTDRMSLVSIGTGMTKRGRGDKFFLGKLSHAKHLPPALIGAMQSYQDLLCRAHGECRYGPPIDGEVGAMVRPSEKAEYLYARYDKVFSDEDLTEAKEITKQGITLDNLELMDFLCEKGAEQATEVVKLEHFEND